MFGSYTRSHYPALLRGKFLVDFPIGLSVYLLRGRFHFTNIRTIDGAVYFVGYVEYLGEVEDCFRESQPGFLHVYRYRVGRLAFVAEIGNFPNAEALFCLEQFYRCAGCSFVRSSLKRLL